MQKFFSLVLIALLFNSCYHDNKQEAVVPDKLLSEDELVKVMTDIQLAEGIITYQRFQRANIKKEYKDTVYMVVLSNYGLTVNDLNDNLDYYNSNPENMELLYEKVLSNLSKLQSEVELAAKKDTISEVKDE